jgi:Lon protease-like protein
MAVMAMFPLGTVLLPGAVLPLHVFEDRYRRMVHDLLSDDVDPPEFGVVLIERGHEVGGGEQRGTVGVVARIVDIQVAPDGRYALAAVGTDRFRVNAWLPDDPYPIADIDLWPDESDDIPREAPAARLAELHDRVRTLNDEVRAAGEMTPPPDTEISDDPVLAAYHLGSLAPLGPADRYRMLTAPTLNARLDVLESALDDAAAVLKFGRS